MLRVIKAAQRLGFTLDEVADLLELGRHRHGQRADAGLQQRAADETGRGRGAHRRPESPSATTSRRPLDAGCDDLIACASAQCCPIPFEAITTHPDTA